VPAGATRASLVIRYHLPKAGVTSGELLAGVGIQQP
jgi:hypothetical protein